MANKKIPGPGEGKRGEQGYFGYLLRQATTAYRARMEKALAKLEITPPQFSVLTMIAAYEGVSNADLARLSLLTPQTVSVIVNNLEKSGAITRRAHAVHGRIQQLQITTLGLETLAQCKSYVKEVEQELSMSLTEEEACIVKRWLVSIAVNAES
ncbi:MarR family transcriptional regulator [Undibacterium jejuense]|uniref:MarR family transcriptional regulator n=1 Tax=Undibacterium jejuense TaxID=1344949 RepID=A0A923HNX6_9BURK|nr:MarR family transcriptional regulator [Undibacterium jejuense]MBC3862088.1 MarR family transcriptional regulator [Undibacterium jejuense]